MATPTTQAACCWASINSTNYTSLSAGQTATQWKAATPAHDESVSLANDTSLHPNKLRSCPSVQSRGRIGIADGRRQPELALLDHGARDRPWSAQRSSRQPSRKVRSTSPSRDSDHSAGRADGDFTYATSGGHRARRTADECRVLYSNRDDQRRQLSGQQFADLHHRQGDRDRDAQRAFGLLRRNQ